VLAVSKPRIHVLSGSPYTWRALIVLETPALAGWYERIAARPSVQASWPPHWRDSDGKDVGLNEVQG
jgi:glutathione S-transferase